MGRKRHIFISHEVPDFSDEAGQARCVCSGSYKARSHHPSVQLCISCLTVRAFVALLHSRGRATRSELHTGFSWSDSEFVIAIRPPLPFFSGYSHFVTGF